MGVDGVLPSEAKRANRGVAFLRDLPTSKEVWGSAVSSSTRVQGGATAIQQFSYTYSAMPSVL